MEPCQIRVAVVDDHTLFRKGVTSLMSEFNELQIVFEAENGLHMQDMLGKQLLPDVILMDINMPVMDGYEATKWLKIHHPKIKVLALSMSDDDRSVIGMIRAGGAGYMLKESRPKELLAAINTVFRQGCFTNDLVTGKLIRALGGQEAVSKLSAKEVAFLKLCCSELTYKEIADQLSVSPRTVDNYRESLFQKLCLKSRTGLVLYAIQNQIFKF